MSADKADTTPETATMSSTLSGTCVFHSRMRLRGWSAPTPRRWVARVPEAPGLHNDDCCNSFAW